MEEEKMRVSAEYCRFCGHFSTGGGIAMCDYILDTGTRRPCPAGKGCIAHTQMTKKAVRDRRQDICVSTRPEVYRQHNERKKPGRQPMIDFTALH